MPEGCTFKPIDTSYYDDVVASNKLRVEEDNKRAMLEKLREVYEDNKVKTNPSSPPHYRFGGNLQTIDLIHEVLSKQQDGFLAYCLGNVFKYLTRFGRKDGIQDLRKALQYLTWMVEHVEKGMITHD